MKQETREWLLSFAGLLLAAAISGVLLFCILRGLLHILPDRKTDRIRRERLQQDRPGKPHASSQQNLIFSVQGVHYCIEGNFKSLKKGSEVPFET